jgi:hypothetical protein
VILLHVSCNCAEESERDGKGRKDWYVGGSMCGAHHAEKSAGAAGIWDETVPLSMQCRPIHEVLVTGASPCRLDDMVISSLFINLVLCHQNC